MLSTIVMAVGDARADAPAGNGDETPALRPAVNGDARAAFALGMRFADPDDGSGDDVEAVRWLRQAAEQGLAEAQYNLGLMYANGRGVERDPVQAAHWYRQAAEQGFADAQYDLGIQYGIGDGVPRDEQLAATWFKRAALQDVPEAAYNLGVLYDLGRGVETDMAIAMQWYERAAGQGYHPAASRLAALRAAYPSLAGPSASTAAVPRKTPANLAQPAPALLPVEPIETPSTTPRTGSSDLPADAAQPPMAGARSASPWLARLDSNHYTLQVLSHTDEVSVRRYLKENFDDGEAGYFAFELDGKTWYSVVYGDYASYSQASAAVKSLAGRLRGPKPWVRKVAVIQQAATR